MPWTKKFLTGDTVVFDDTATSFTPNILANQTPAGVTFDNTTAYTLSSTGAFGIAGTGGLIKKNTGTVTISSANTYTGTTDVQAGTLIANYNTGTAQTVFATASTINVASGATFRAVANDADVTLANNLTGSGLVVIDPHFTAGAGRSRWKCYRQQRRLYRNFASVSDRYRRWQRHLPHRH